MTKSITMLPGASANGDVGQGLLTGGNTYSCSDGVADELVNRGKAFYVYPAPPTPTVSFNALRSAAQLAGVPPAADVALSATTQFYDPAQVVDATHPYVYYTATLAAYVRIGGASAPVSVSPTLVPYSSTIPLDGNKYSGDHTLTSNEVLTPGATVEGGSYYVDINPAGFTPDVSAFKVRGDAFNSAHIMQAIFGFQRIAQLIWIDLGALPAFTSQAAPAGTVGTAYSYTFVATGATSYSLVSGTLPAGLTLASTTGVLSGTPTAAATSTFVIGATNSTGTTNSSTQSVTIAAANAPAFTAQSASAGTVGTAYTYQYAASNTTSFALASGTLPAGLTLSASGLLSGTPTTPATSSFVISATGVGGTTNSIAQSVVVSVAPVGRTDTFTRADNAVSLGTPSDGGSAWVTSGLVAGIASNKAYFNDASPSRTLGLSYLQLPQVNSAAQATFTIDNTFLEHETGLAFGIVDANNFYRAIIGINGFDGKLVLDYILGGARQTPIANIAVPSYNPTGTYVVSVTRNSSSGVMSVSVNGNVLITATDTTFMGGTKAGITVSSDGGGGATPGNVFSAFSAS